MYIGHFLPIPVVTIPNVDKFTHGYKIDFIYFFLLTVCPFLIEKLTKAMFKQLARNRSHNLISFVATLMPEMAF